MPGKRKYLLEVGQRFNCLEVVAVKTSLSGRDWRSKRVRYVCRCVCGNTVVGEGYRIATGHTSSCGCRKREVAKKTVCLRRTHGRCHTPEYMTWVRMRRRCENSESQDYHNYGARGIKVCERWKVFANFYADMGERPGKGYMIDRVDNDGDYEPENCRWTTVKESNRNRRNIRFLVIDGIRKGLGEWAEESGTNLETIRSRLQRGWDSKEAVFGEIRQEMKRTGNRWRKRK